MSFDPLDQGTWCQHGGEGEPFVCIECGNHTGGNDCPDCGRPLCKACEQNLQQFFDESIGYPPGWPKCPGCGRPAMDGHITCGRVECGEGARR